MSMQMPAAADTQNAKYTEMHKGIFRTALRTFAVFAFLALAGAAHAAGSAAAEPDLISGKVIVALFSAIFAAGGGIFIGNAHGRKTGEEEAERRRIEGKVDANVPQPLATEQSAYQAHCKDNDKDHTNLFSRMATVEQKLAAIDAKVDATFISIQRQLDSLTNMVTQLFDRICKKK